MPVRRITRESRCIWLLITNIISSILIDPNIVDRALHYLNLVSCELREPFFDNFLHRFGVLTVDDWVQKPKTSEAQYVHM